MTMATLAPPAAIRVVRVPRSEPPTDVEREAHGGDVAATAIALPLDLPGTRKPRPRLATGRAAAPSESLQSGGAVHRPALDIEVEVQPVETISARLATRRFLATCVEVIGGFRPASQLRSSCLPESFLRIADRLAGSPTSGPAGRSRGVAYSAGRTPVTGRSIGARPRVSRTIYTAPVDRVSIRRVQVCEVGEYVAEVAVVLGQRDRVWAMALRFERRGGRWLCSCLEVL
jgi:hypothetical protein